LYYEPKGENLQNLILMESKIQVINATF
jgi:hypothetical protein